MRRNVLCAVSLTALSFSPALAADVTALPEGNWTGAWLGVGAGGSYLLSDFAIDSDKYEKTPSVFKEERIREADVAAQMFTGTAEAGVDYQVGEQLVLGLVSNFDFGSGSGHLYSDKMTANNPDTAKEVYDAEVELGNSWAVGARAGLLFGPRTMFYGTGGFTQAEVSVHASYKDKTGTDAPTKDWSTENDGWTSGVFFGGGVETMVTDHVSAKLEYRFSRYDAVSADAKTETDGTKFYESTVSTGDLDVQSVRATVAYHFGNGIAAADAVATESLGDWTGAWIGAGAGGSSMLSELAIDSDKYTGSPSELKEERIREADVGAEMFMGIVEAGVDYQVGEKLVLGVVSNFDFGSGSGHLFSDKTTANNPDTAKEVYDAEVEVGNSWAVGARAGLLLTPNTMVFGTGGITQADVSVQASYKDKTGTDNPEKDWSTESDGWTSGMFVGGGIETMLTDHVSAKLEYRFARYDDMSADAKAEGSNSYYESTVSTGDIDVQSLRATVAWRF
ncbi:outer membrane protein [Aestuariivirga sp.]|uniref:outer membrane protein n=1 Tax=Aestuariivirga sp. TaxID=2650926 RepID=UPI0037834094